MPICRYSKYAQRSLRPKHPDRVGEFLGEVRNRPTAVKVKWEGLKCVTTYHRDFIEVIDDDGPDQLEDRGRTRDELKAAVKTSS